MTNNFLISETVRMWTNFSPIQILAGIMQTLIFIRKTIKNPMLKVYSGLFKQNCKCLVNGRILSIALLASLFLPLNCHAERLGIKIPDMFFSKSHPLFPEYGSFNNKLYIKDGVWNSYDTSPSGGFLAYTFESVSSTVLGAVGVVSGMFLSTKLPIDDENRKAISWVFAGITLIGAPLGAAGGTSIAGELLHQESSFKKAYKGAITGGLIASVAPALLIGGLSRDPALGAYIGALFCIPGAIIGSVIGYNKGGNYE